jgi:hypothetical protein
MISTGANPLRAGFWEPLDVDDMVFDALLGIFMFKVSKAKQQARCIQPQQHKAKQSACSNCLHMHFSVAPA